MEGGQSPAAQSVLSSPSGKGAVLSGGKVAQHPRVLGNDQIGVGAGVRCPGSSTAVLWIPTVAIGQFGRQHITFNQEIAEIFAAD